MGGILWPPIMQCVLPAGDDSCAWANLRIAQRSGNPACRFLAETGGGRRRTVAPGCCPLARHVAEHHLDTMKILVVEDDRETASYLVKGLSESGYIVDRASDGRDGLFPATSGSYDAIVLDRMLPSMDGLAMLGALRAAAISTPALILSALGSV